MKYLKNKKCRIHGQSIITTIVDGKSTNLCFNCYKFNIFKRLGYKIYHPEVRRFHESLASTKVCYAPARTTKSYSAAHELLIYCLLNDTMSWIVGPSYDLAEKELRVVFSQLVTNGQKLGIEPPSSYSMNKRAGTMFIKWEKRNSVVEGKSAERPDRSLLGERVHVALYSEAAQMKRVIRERFIYPRLMLDSGTELIPSTPAGGAEWMWELSLKGQEPEWKGIIESFHWDFTANPLYPKSEFEKARKVLGEDSPAFREQYLGEWVFFEGNVYGKFNLDDHVIEPFEIPKSWKRIRAIDFGVRDPFVCLWAAIGPEGEIYFYKEYYYKNQDRSIPVHSQFIKELSKGEEISQTVADPQAAQSILDLRRTGVYCSKAINDQLSGRQKVIDYLTLTPEAPAPYGQKRDKKDYPRIYFFNTMVETIREVKFYRYIESNKRQDAKELTEGDDHAMDCVKYLCATRPSPFRRVIQQTYNTFDYFRNKVTQARLLKRQRRIY